MKQQKYPKVKFYASPLEHFIHSMTGFLNQSRGEWDWSSSILNSYPVLKVNLENVKDTSKREKIIRKFFSQFVLENKKIMKNRAVLFQKEWDKVNDKYMKTLSSVLEIEWPKNDKVMTAYVSPNPICPRSISYRWFDVYFSASVEHMKGTAMHEILHFLYFEKWKEVFPETKRREFDPPYLAWKLSEMVPLTIISDKRIQKVFHHDPHVYREYKRLKIKGKPLLDYLQEFYSKRRNFEDFLRKSWAFVRKYKKEIDKA